MRGRSAMYAGMPPYETLAIVRSMGMQPIGRPTREGPTYVLRATDRRGQERRVVLDARSGDVLDSVPVVREQGYPGARVVRLPDRDNDDEIDITPPSPYPPRVIPAPRSVTPPAPRTSAVTPTQRSAQPPVPRPRPDDAQTASVPAAPPVPASNPVENKPAEAKPAETKPAETQPAEAKPKVFVPDVAPLD